MGFADGIFCLVEEQRDQRRRFRGGEEGSLLEEEAVAVVADELN